MLESPAAIRIDASLRKDIHTFSISAIIVTATPDIDMNSSKPNLVEIRLVLRLIFPDLVIDELSVSFEFGPVRTIILDGVFFVS